MASVSTLSLSDLAACHLKTDINKGFKFFSNEPRDSFETAPEYLNVQNLSSPPPRTKQDTISSPFDFSEIFGITDEISLEASPVEELSLEISTEDYCAAPSMFGLVMSGDLKKETRKDQSAKIEVCYDSCFGYSEQNRDSPEQSVGRMNNVELKATNSEKGVIITPFNFSTPSPDEIIKINQKAVL